MNDWLPSRIVTLAILVFSALFPFFSLTSPSDLSPQATSTTMAREGKIFPVSRRTIPLQTSLDTQALSTKSISPKSGEQISRLVAAQEWLGPISAIALSPFFGLTILSGMATYGPTALREHSSLLGITGPMNNPVLFWCMAILTVITSLPRLTKFSKPLAMAAEKIEAYSAVIILIALRFTADYNAGDPSTAFLHDSSMPLAQAGFLSLPFDALLALAMAVNLIVVNTVKLLIDVLIWLIPFPSIDALLELTNKAICGLLLGIYAFSPWLALGINMVIFAVSALLFFRAKRRLSYFHELMVMPIWSRLTGATLENAKPKKVFLAKAWRGFPALTCGELHSTPDRGSHEIVLRGWTAHFKHSGRLEPSAIATGLIADTWVLESDGETIEILVRKGLLNPSQVTTPRSGIPAT
jgi:hypothetical protein